LPIHLGSSVLEQAFWQRICRKVGLALQPLGFYSCYHVHLQRRIASLTDDITYKGTHKLSVKADTKTVS
jgi:hypothetical protein